MECDERELTTDPKLADLITEAAPTDSSSSSRAASPAMKLGIPLPGMEEDHEYLEKCSNDSKGSTPSSGSTPSCSSELAAPAPIKPKTSSWFGFGSSTPRTPAADQPTTAAPVARKTSREVADQKMARKREQRSAGGGGEPQGLQR